MTSPFVLCADDYALTEGVSAAILTLARGGRISATSAMTVSPHWPAHALALKDLRGRLALGLHVTLTGGLAPLGPMPRLAPDGRLPGIGALTRTAFLGRLDGAEIEAEIGRQLDEFIDRIGYPPDHIDGHQHAHALPGVRTALLAALHRRGLKGPLLIRDPGDRIASILRRRRAVAKSLALNVLSTGFASAVRAAGFTVNDSFAGVCDFAPAGVAADFKTASLAAGPLHLVMCHAGHVDAELRALDPVTDRREAEFTALMTCRAIPTTLWNADRAPDGPCIDWAGLARGPASHRPPHTEPHVAHYGARHWAGFLVAGTLAFATDALVLEALTRLMGVGPLKARIVAISAAMVAGWLGHRRLTFTVASRPTVREFLAYLALGWSAATLNYAIYAGILLLRPLTAPFSALFLASLAAMLASYLGMRLGVFARNTVKP